MKQLTYKQLNMILAGLRRLQSDDGCVRQLPHFDNVEPLNKEEIDNLCKEMNEGHVCIFEDISIIESLNNAPKNIGVFSHFIMPSMR